MQERAKFVPKPLSERPRLARKFPTEKAMSDIKHYFRNGNQAIQTLIQEILKKYIINNRPGSQKEASIHEKVMNIAHYANRITVAQIAKEIEDTIDSDKQKYKFT